jgi:hypothetical protein
VLAGVVACSSSPSSPSTEGTPDAASPGDASSSDFRDAASAVLADGAAGNDVFADAASADVDADAGATLAASRFVTGVVSFEPGPCAGFGESSMPGVVEGPPHGDGTTGGGTDVVSLGNGGTIVVSFAPSAIVDGPGPDFIVFENPFWVNGNPNDIFAEPGEVSVSDDGVTWHTFPCSPTVDPESPHGTGVAPPYGECAGWHPVLSNPSNGISPIDPAVAGGDAFDLSELGVAHARYVRIVDKTLESCPDAGSPGTNGFDLDAVSIVNVELQ